MIYLGNGMYSDSGRDDVLMHYGVLGMKWGVRKARNIANDVDRQRRIGTRVSLRKMYRNGQISKEQYKMAKRRIRADFKNAKRENAEYAKNTQEYLRGQINAGKTKGIKARALRENAYKLADKQLPGYSKFKKAYDNQIKATALFGPLGNAAVAINSMKYAKAFDENNQALYDAQARKYAKPISSKQYSDAEKWKMIGDFYASQEKKRRR